MVDVRSFSEKLFKPGSVDLVLKVLNEGAPTANHLNLRVEVNGSTARVGGMALIFALNHGRSREHPGGWVVKDGNGTPEDPSFEAGFTVNRETANGYEGSWHGLLNGISAAGFFSASPAGEASPTDINR